MWSSLDGFAGKCWLRTWVYRVAHNVAASHVVRQRRLRSQTLVDLEDVEATLVDRVSPARLDFQQAVDQLYAFQASYDLPRDIGARYEYSNLGVGLLGHVLSRHAGVDYETLVRTRITGPLDDQHRGRPEGSAAAAARRRAQRSA